MSTGALAIEGERFSGQDIRAQNGTYTRLCVCGCEHTSAAVSAGGSITAGQPNTIPRPLNDCSRFSSHMLSI